MWRSDLQYLSSTLPQLHANLYFNVTRAEFEKAVSQLYADIPGISEEEIIAGMARIVAMVRDAHTSLSLQQSSANFQSYPIRLRWFQDGLFVVQTAPGHRRALARKLIRIGNYDMTQVLGAVRAVISFENEQWFKYMSQSYLAIPEVLSSLHLVADKGAAPFVFDDGQGGTFTLVLAPMAQSAYQEWVDAFEDGTTPRPLFTRASDLPYWYHYLSEGQVLYIKYNQCQSIAAMPFDELAGVILEFLDSHPFGKLALDLRDNTGGYSSVITPLFNGIGERVQKGKIDIASQIYTIIGKATISSSMLNAIQVKSGGGNLLGEPSGGKPNHYGEVRSLSLPGSQLQVSYSTKFFQTQALDTPSLMPDVLIEVSSQDYFSGRDPVLRNLLAEKPPRTSTVSLAVPRGGGTALNTTGVGDSPTAMYVRIDSRNGSASPAAQAIFRNRQAGVTISEATVPATLPLQSGRIYAESAGDSKTGVAIANAANAETRLSFSLADASGREIRTGILNLPAGGQIARFLDEEPFSTGQSFSGTFSYSTSNPVAVTTLHGLQNERAEFLMTTLPLSDPVSTAGQMLYLAHFSDGAGWSSRIILVNPLDRPIAGALQFLSPGSSTTPASPVTLTMGGETASVFSYQLPPRGSRSLSTSGLGASILSGSVRITPAAEDPPPQAMELFAFKQEGVTVSEAGIPALVSSTGSRLFVEYSGGFRSGAPGSVQTGIAITNSRAAALPVRLTLRYLNGAAAASPVTVVIPGSGQIAMFLHEIPGLDRIATPYTGVLELSADQEGFAAIGLRARFNERGDFLITTLLPMLPKSGASGLFFPHVADGGGYQTQMVLMNPTSSQGLYGTLRFFSQSGQPWNLDIR